MALSIEASLQQRYPLNSVAWYIFVFSASTLYYTYAYMGEASTNTTNVRTLWYIHNRKNVIASQIIFTFIAALAAIYICINYGKGINSIKMWQWVVIAMFPFVAALYYGLPFKGWGQYNLRRTGWLKPFLIAFVWAGSVTVYPLIFSQVQTGMPYTITWLGVLLFVKNLMFASVLGIMFDIKDYATDYNKKLKTFVVRVGLRKTLFYIIMPLSMLGFVSFLVFAFLEHFPAARVLLNCIPFIALLMVGYSMHRRKSIMYYLVVIDGLLLVKAFCGILAMLLIN